MYRPITLALLTCFLCAPFLAAQTKPVRPRSSADAGASCNRAGEVLERNAFLQTLLLRLHDGQMETVPFSRWTEFCKTATSSVTGLRRAIEPSEIQPGDRLCVRLDPSEATSSSILVLEPVRPPHQTTKPPSLQTPTG